MGTRGDNPIKDKADDQIGRLVVAERFAADIRDVDPSEGYAVAIIGPWGSGKTSLLNMVKSELSKEPALPIVEFNPWMFSGAEQLVEAFFGEVSAQLRLKEGRLTGIAEELDAYGDLLSPLAVLPVVGSWITRFKTASGAFKTLSSRRKESVNARRDKLAGKLSELDRPIVVVIDDIDRLNELEIKDIFKLVRLTASFPNIIYVLAFDRERVERALAETGIDGRSYLEKIVQISLDLPVLPEETLVRQIGKALEDAIGEPEGLLFDEGRWPDVLMEVIRPLIKNMRDVRRYAASVKGSLRALDNQVETVDLLALEAIRVFRPDIFTKLIGARSALTKPPSGYGRDENPQLKESIEEMFKAAGQDEAVAKALIRRVFPAGIRHFENNTYGADWLREWLRQRRAAHSDILNMYLEMVANDKLKAFSKAEQAFTLLADQQALEEYLGRVDPDELEDVISSLEVYEGEFAAQAIVPASIVLMNKIAHIPNHPKGLFEIGDPSLTVRRVVLRMLRQLASESDKVKAILEIYPELDSLSSRLELVQMAGHRDGVGHKLISEEAASKLETQWEEDLRRADEQDLEKEWDLLRVVATPGFWDKDSKPVITSVTNRALTAQLLLSAKTEVRSGGLDTRAVKRKSRLHWTTLLAVYGDDQRLKDAVKLVRETNPTNPQLTEALDLADKYLSGWDPNKEDD